MSSRLIIECYFYKINIFTVKKTEMEVSCTKAPVNKKEYITDIGNILVKEYGKKKYYKPAEVKKAHEKSNWYDGLDFFCWGMSTFSSHLEFDLYHKKIGETCNYIEMKKEMLEGLTISSAFDWLDIPDLDLDVSWLDFETIFDGILEGIGEVISQGKRIKLSLGSIP